MAADWLSQLKWYRQKRGGIFYRAILMRYDWSGNWRGGRYIKWYRNENDIPKTDCINYHSFDYSVKKN